MLSAESSPLTPDNSLEAFTNASANNNVDQVSEWLYRWRSAPNSSPTQPLMPLRSVLHVAARNDSVEVVEYLLEQGFEIDPATIVSATAGNAIHVFETLLHHGWDINTCLGHTGDALILAAAADKTSLVHFLLSRHADPNANVDSTGYTALERAASSASAPTVRLLVDAGALIETRSVLAIAARQGKVDVVTCLLERGANVDAIADNEDILENERKSGIGNALCAAAKAGRVDVIRVLIRWGADTGVRDSLGRTAVELAEMGGYSVCIEVLNTG